MTLFGCTPVVRDRSLSMFDGGAGWWLARLFASFLLATAAAMKCYQFATGPVPESGPLSTRWIAASLAALEWLGSLLLISGIAARAIRLAALISFCAFAVVALTEGFAGRESCGCFGRWELHPFVAATVDVLVVLSLLKWRPLRTSSLSGRRLAIRAACVFFGWGLVGGPAAYAMLNYKPTTVDSAGALVERGRVVVLEPERWIGRPLPILRYIEDLPERLKVRGRSLRDELAEGDWLVVFFRHDCPKCRENMPKYAELGRRAAQDPTAAKLAFVELAPYGKLNGVPAPNGGAVARARLSDNWVWFIEAPTELCLRSGRVVSVVTGG